MTHILLGVTGSIAAYKALEIVRLLRKENVTVEAILTRAASELITPLSLQTLTGEKVYTDMFEPIPSTDVRHISLAKRADAILIAPATANIIGKIAGGIADDMLTTVTMAAYPTPVIFAPAMNSAMYQNPVVRRNIQTLRSDGYHFIEPRQALLACGDTGIGALADVSDIVQFTIRTAEEAHGKY